MRKIKLGKTSLQVTKVGFGALPIQRCSVEDSTKILSRAYESGINLYDTARAYSDSEEKIGIALGSVRKNIIIATKTHAKTLDEMKLHISQSLTNLQTDYIDIYQFHLAKAAHSIDDPMYQYMLQLKEQGIIRHIGITTHTHACALEIIHSGLYETLQYPVNCISEQKDIDIITMCEQANIGFIAMKGMAGGLINDPYVAFSFYEQYANTVPVWGVQTVSEIEDFIALDASPPSVDDTITSKMQAFKDELGANFCRGCGYCLSACPQNIQINTCARMTLLCGRAVWQNFLTSECAAEMDKINSCTSCGACIKKCPYNLDIPVLLRQNLQDYIKFTESHK